MMALALGTSGPNGPANFANVGAVEFEFIGKLQATDLTIDSISTSVFDWGDLPQDSSTCLSAPTSGTKLLYARFRLFLASEISGLSTNLLIPYQFDGRNGFGAANNPNEILTQSKSGEVEDYR